MNLRALSPPATATAALLSCLFLLSEANPASGQGAPMSSCADWREFTEHLEKNYGEVVVGVGLVGGGRTMLEVYASESGSFTVLATTAGGPTCMVATGEGWQSIKPRPPKPEEKGL